jgi:hypothetical protein
MAIPLVKINILILLIIIGFILLMIFTFKNLSDIYKLLLDNINNMSAIYKSVISNFTNINLNININHHKQLIIFYFTYFSLFMVGLILIISYLLTSCSSSKNKSIISQHPVFFSKKINNSQKLNNNPQKINNNSEQYVCKDYKILIYIIYIIIICIYIPLFILFFKPYLINDYLFSKIPKENTNQSILSKINSILQYIPLINSKNIVVQK